jgi:hypothetical protein
MTAKYQQDKHHAGRNQSGIKLHFHFLTDLVANAGISSQALHLKNPEIIIMTPGPLHRVCR